MTVYRALNDLIERSIIHKSNQNKTNQSVPECGSEGKRLSKPAACLSNKLSQAATRILGRYEEAGSIGAATSLTLEDATSAVQAMADAARAVHPHILVLCHGGPIATPADAAYVLGRNMCPATLQYMHCMHTSLAHLQR